MLELTVVLALVLVAATLVAPNVTAFARGQEERQFLSRLERLVQEARREALRSTDGEELRYESAANAFRLSDANRSATLPAGGTVDSDREDGKEWTVKFYADGTAQARTATIVLPDGGRYMLRVQANGETEITRVEANVAPEPSEPEEWEAGEFERRA